MANHYATSTCEYTLISDKLSSQLSNFCNHFSQGLLYTTMATHQSCYFKNTCTCEYPGCRVASCSVYSDMYLCPYTLFECFLACRPYFPSLPCFYYVYPISLWVLIIMHYHGRYNMVHRLINPKFHVQWLPQSVTTHFLMHISIPQLQCSWHMVATAGSKGQVIPVYSLFYTLSQAVITAPNRSEF